MKSRLDGESFIHVLTMLAAYSGCSFNDPYGNDTTAISFDHDMGKNHGLMSADTLEHFIRHSGNSKVHFTATGTAMVIALEAE